jgi:phosphoribosylamine--glycine ligase
MRSIDSLVLARYPKSWKKKESVMGMKVLVVGQGGREHALVRALKQSPSVGEVHALPGSDGIAQDAICHSQDWRDFAAVTACCQREGFDLVVIGPENPLVEGLADVLRVGGVAVFGPSREAARLEGSKVFCKEFLLEAGVPTARSIVVNSVDNVRRAAGEFVPPYVLKADGLAAGKGVYICKTFRELEDAARDLFDHKVLGAVGERALLEEFKPGYEISYLVLTDGESFEPLPLAQDHKRLFDRDEGPNTGGMGVVAPMVMDHAMRSRIDREVILPTLRLMQKRASEGGGFLFRGVLFVGLMMTDEGPSVLEFNTRFGDPEIQAILPLFDGDWGVVFRETAMGRLPKMSWKNLCACCVVLAAAGYPDAPVKGLVIDGVRQGAEGVSYLLHAGTKKEASNWVTNGGRVLNAIGLGANLNVAVERAYELALSIHSKGMQVRRDIGAKALDV